MIERYARHSTFTCKAQDFGIVGPMQADLSWSTEAAA